MKISMTSLSLKISMKAARMTMRTMGQEKMGTERYLSGKSAQLSLVVV